MAIRTSESLLALLAELNGDTSELQRLYALNQRACNVFRPGQTMFWIGVLWALPFTACMVLPKITFCASLNISKTTCRPTVGIVLWLQNGTGNTGRTASLAL